MAFIQVSEPMRPTLRFSFLALGFRPFFLLAAGYAMLAVPLWLLIYSGAIEPVSYLPPSIWHAHEMIFGFAMAVIAGFLLTAASNWTAQATAQGLPLAALVILWIAGRILLASGGALPFWLPVTVDVAFLPCVALALAIPLIRTRNRRNLVFPALLLLLAALNFAIQAGAVGLLPVDPSRGLRAAVDIIILVITILGGRVIPSFTRNVFPAASSIGTCKIANALTLASTAAFFLVDCSLGDSVVTGITALVVAIANILRVRRWGWWLTARTPALWILHLGYGWIIIGMTLRGLSGVAGLVPLDAGLHALTAGAISLMSVGMMARVALGHTGRKIEMGGLVTSAFVGLTVAAFLRLAVPFLPVGLQHGFLVAAAITWSLSFALFIIRYLPILIKPRADGRSG